MYDEFPTGVLVAWGVIGAAYGATCVWIGIRLFNHRERWVKLTSVALAGGRTVKIDWERQT